MRPSRWTEPATGARRLVGDPSVLEPAVIGVPDEKWGEVGVAYVQPRPGATVEPSALEALCARSLAGHKRPTAFLVVDAMPPCRRTRSARSTKPRCMRDIPPSLPGPDQRAWLCRVSRWTAQWGRHTQGRGPRALVKLLIPRRRRAGGPGYRPCSGRRSAGVTVAA
ncbi:hypothetical protein [Streptomyces sp. NPDC058307]|uniref:AMP-binding enzyme n=1 Tax=Streptomyces sp. NPDC058307 TaxID=3346439 RepID=UPI0036EA6A0A